MNTRCLAPLLALSLLSAGCQMHKPPLQGDDTYPSDWPKITNLGVECNKLNGWYANEGVVTARTGDQQVMLLTSILPHGLKKEVSSGSIVALRVVTQKVGRNGKDTFATLEFNLNGKPDQGSQHKDCFCIEHALMYSPKQSAGGIPYLWFGGGQMNVWLTMAEDGSLIAKIWNSSAGIAVVVPYYKENHVWAKFNRIER